MSQSLEILFKNDDFVVINKPAGWLSIPAREPKPSDQVVTLSLRNLEHVGSAWPVHRLDRFTSGVMLIALSEEAQRKGAMWFQNREVKKVYHFFACPTPSRPAVQIKTPVDGKPAQTLFEVLEKKGDFFLGRAIPLTGRFHQIRDHAEQAEFPILGDHTHGGLEMVPHLNGERPVPRVCLHAYSLKTPLGEFQAPLPDDMKKLWEEIQS